ncbi:MAG: carbohydrate ABC transporter permease [Microthrixaceae bacterium]
MTDTTPAEARIDTPGRPVAQQFKALGWYVLLTVLALIILYPLYMSLMRALSDPAAYARAGNPPWPVEAEWDVFSKAWNGGNLSAATFWSFAMSAVITITQVVTAVLSAYAFVFLRFPFKRLLFVLFVATLMLPLEVTFVANSLTIRQLDWIDTLQGLTAPFLASALGTFLLRQGFLGIPKELREAAFLDGYGHIRFMTRIAVPLTAPVVASVGLLAFLSSWNQYLWPRVVTEQENHQTLQIALRRLGAANVQQINVGVAGAVLAALPIFALLILFQRAIVRGLTAGAVKG